MADTSLNALMSITDFCPGNGTRYHLVHGKIGDKVLVSWLYDGDSGGGSICVKTDGYLDPGYLSSKMQLRNSAEADCVALLVFLRETYDLQVYIPSNYDPETGLWIGR